MSGTESFEQAMTEMAGNVASPYWIGMVERLKAAHEREILYVSQQSYHSGFNDGQHSMDAEHRSVAMRLRHLPLDGGSHENLSQIARAVYHSDFGWTHGACASLRDELVRLMGGVSDDTCDSQCRGACADSDGGDSGKQVEVSDGGTADDCGADSRGGDGGGDLHMAGVRITDELREFVGTFSKRLSISVAEVNAIADRIDAQFDRICQQHEDVLQKTVDEMVKEYEHDRESDQLRVEKLEKQRDHWRQQATDMMNHADAMEHERDEAYARTDELSDELLRTRRERDELRHELCETKLELESLRARIAEDANDHVAWQIEIQELQEKLDKYDSTYDELRKQRDDVIYQYAELTKKLRRLRQENGEFRQALLAKNAECIELWDNLCLESDERDG